MSKTGNRSRVHRPRLTAFTLIELLVVVSIIALLLSLLLPSLGSAKRIGQRATCMAKLRDIGKGMNEYAQDNEEAIIGGPWTSGAYLVSTTSAWGPAVQTWDFMGPLAHMWNTGFTLPSKNDPASEICKRFNELRSSPAFLCSSNQFLAPVFQGPDAGAGWLPSYNTQRLQLAPDSWASLGGPGSNHTAPPNWKPSVQRIGVPSEKIFCGDGARYSYCAQTPDYDLRPDPGPPGGAFSDAGAYSAYSRSWDRCRAPGNSGSPGGPHTAAQIDPRSYAFRHATAEPANGAVGNAYKGNFVFYDVHVETLGDLDSSSPYLWLPKGSRITPAATEIWPDTINFFGLGTEVGI